MPGQGVWGWVGGGGGAQGVGGQGQEGPSVACDTRCSLQAPRSTDRKPGKGLPNAHIIAQFYSARSPRLLHTCSAKRVRFYPFFVLCCPLQLGPPKKTGQLSTWKKVIITA